MYRISVRLSKILGITDLPFGGMNMVFAGDFAQLPPAVGQEHASLYSRTVGSKSTSLRDQESAVGKALWHQVTTVVILRQNMRQKSQSHEDAQLRKCLTNMRYKACTIEDIAFLRTRITSMLPKRPSLTSDVFRNVSIITALNVHKDEINRLGSRRFAVETSQELVDFFSDDTVASDTDRNKSTRSKVYRGKQQAVPLTQSVQEMLWDQSPSCNDKCIAGKLSLCIGMPIIIRNNTATELCITRGQEGIVHSWQTSVGSKGQRMLDTLFVELCNPPQPVQFEGLPINVVPLTQSAVSVKCILPNDNSITVTRHQVEVLPNFAMTDYASQGKTRHYNPVDLNNCRSHQSYYTALSRSATAAGTCIVQGFDSRMITGGASGALRQEFRELELLDDMCQLQYTGKLDISVVGDRRHTLIQKFRAWKGSDYVPLSVHKAIHWGKTESFDTNMETNEIKWQIIEKPGRSKQLQKNSTETNLTESTLCKRKMQPDLDNHNFALDSSVKRSKMDSCQTTDLPIPQENSAQIPVGTIWSENSCAYDCIVSILYNTWLCNHEITSQRWIAMNNAFLTALVDKFAACRVGICSLESCRDQLRQDLCDRMPNQFVWGRYISLDAVLHQLLQANSVIRSSRHICPRGHNVVRRQTFLHHPVFSVVDGFSGTAQYWITRFESPVSTRCPTCNTALHIRFTLESISPLIILDVSSAHYVRPDPILQVRVHDRPQPHMYHLRGIGYFGGDHFVSRIIKSDGHVWYHDGMETGRSMNYHGLIENYDWRMCRGKKPVIYVYQLQS